MGRTQPATTAADQIPPPLTSPAPEQRTKLVSGRVFTHGIDDKLEWFEHTDEATGMLWTIRRHTDPRAHATVREVWCAYAATPDADGSCVLINGMTTREGELLSKGALADVNDRDPDALLAAMIPLIERGLLPEEQAHETLTIITNGAAGQFLPDPLENLYGRLKTLTLDPSYAEHDPAVSRQPNGDVRAHGKFLDADFYFTVVGPPREMQPLVAAVEAAQGRRDYSRALELHRERRHA